MSSSFGSCVSHAELSTQTVVNYKKGGQRFMNQVQTMPLFDDEGDLAAFASLLHEIPEVKIRRKRISEFFSGDVAAFASLLHTRFQRKTRVFFGDVAAYASLVHTRFPRRRKGSTDQSHAAHPLFFTIFFTIVTCTSVTCTPSPSVFLPHVSTHSLPTSQLEQEFDDSLLNPADAHLWSALTDRLPSSPLSSSGFSGAAAKHAPAACEEAARKLLSNHNDVLADATNDEPIPLSQPELKRIDYIVRPYADQALRTCARRLMGGAARGTLEER